MADETVAEHGSRFDLKDAMDALRLTSQSMAILRSVWLAVEAQEDGVVKYEDGKFSRWGWAVDAARSRVLAVRDLLIGKPNGPEHVDWWTPLNLVEAMGAALWHTGAGSNKYQLTAEEIQSCASAAIDSLGLLYESTNTEYDALETEAIEEGLRD